MKKVLIVGLLMLLSFTGCRKHVYYTCYKAIDTDTMTGIRDTDGSMYYALQCTKMDNALANAMELDSVFQVIFYNPSKDVYFIEMLGSDGGLSPRVYFNPLSGETDSIR